VPGDAEDPPVTESPPATEASPAPDWAGAASESVGSRGGDRGLSRGGGDGDRGGVVSGPLMGGDVADRPWRGLGRAERDAEAGPGVDVESSERRGDIRPGDGASGPSDTGSRADSGAESASESGKFWPVATSSSAWIFDVS
jgi:hypothetical protein